MTFITQYIDALKNIKKRYYLTPFLLLMYFFTVLEAMDPITRFLDYGDNTFQAFVMFTISMLIAYLLRILSMVLYPHASFYIQSTWLYRKTFNTMLGTLGSGLSRYSSIGSNIPDDVHFRDKKGRRYTASASYKTKTERVRNARTDYSLFFLVKFIFKDCILRLFVHTGIFMVSPIIFLIAIPMLNRKGLLQNIEKDTIMTSNTAMISKTL